MSESKVKKPRNKFETLVEEGLVFDAARLFGRAFCLAGTVVDGNKIGRTLGYPTANIFTGSAEVLIPAQGVYAAYAKLKGTWYKSMVNIGIRPTLNLERKTIETHLFDFNQEIYNQFITLHFIERLRDEMRFGSLAELKNQLDQDSKQAKIVFEKLALNPLPEVDFVFFGNGNSSN